MLKQDTPIEHILSSNETHTVKEFIELSCKYAGLNYKWIGNDKELLVNDQVIIKINEKYYSPAEVDMLYCYSLETHRLLKWKPKVKFNGI
jgi:GDPmannose 4,6-dehydratase